jgi:superfamily II RNA helicase
LIESKLSNSFITLKPKQKKKLKHEMIQIQQSIDDFNKKYGIIKSLYDYDELILRKTKDIQYIRNYIKTDIDNIIRFMVEYKYMTETTNELTIKGHIASEINECNELLLTELINDKILNELEPYEIVAVLPCFIEEKENSFNVQTIDSLKIPIHVTNILKRIGNKARILADEEYKYDIDIKTNWNLYLSFIEPTYYWAVGWSIFEIHSKICHIYDGNFIRNILRINNICENLKSICDINKDDILLKKLESVEKMLVRDQVSTDSLYI